MSTFLSLRCGARPCMSLQLCDDIRCRAFLCATQQLVSFIDSTYICILNLSSQLGALTAA
eukprot:3639197-Rhodomonas_salina.1